MGSLPSPPPSTPPRSPETSLSHNRVYALFCFKEPGPNSNISNWLDCYNPVDNTWTHVTPIPGLIENHLLKDFAMISIGESIYIIGGRLCRKDRSQLQIPSSPTSTSYGGEERWPKIQRRYLTMATIGTHLCLLAGYRNIEESSLSKSRVHVLDTSATGGTWRCLEPTEEEGEKELCSHCCVVQFP
ncbi:hypothetical protein TEA_027377 [Camellia sinensis var. sinensis]|uniref:F-box associated domain-containing protein n=1 Tax=Camellia sinensis var. sinensis TaxID=542762 RepID=A0A4S4DAU4_CAMSN|nr:hypothetical protein TEA_027377 [Camellia sinensis var. sinensis]